MKIAEIQLTYNPKIKADKWPRIMCSEDAYNAFLPKFEKDMNFREHMMMLLVNRNNKMKGIAHLSTGGIHGTVLDKAIVFGTAAKALASGIIFCHNHPSGNLTPSKTDINTTDKFVEAGKIMDIEVLDHLIISNEGFLSMADEGLI